MTKISKSKKIKAGRPTKRTELESMFLEAIELGASIKEACQTVGITMETYSQWMKKFPSFSKQKRIAELKPMARALKAVIAGMYRDWRAAAWWLERRCPEEFGLRRSSIEEPPDLVISAKPSQVKPTRKRSYDKEKL